MDTLFVYCHRSQADGLLAELPREIEIEVVNPKYWILRRGDMVLYLDIMEKLREEVGLDDEGVRDIMQSIRDPIALGFSYHDEEFCKEVVMAIGNREDVIIDNEYGVRLRGDRMVKEMRSRPGVRWGHMDEGGSVK